MFAIVVAVGAGLLTGGLVSLIFTWWAGILPALGIGIGAYVLLVFRVNKQVQAAMVRLSPARCVAIRCVCSVPCRVRWGRVSCYP